MKVFEGYGEDSFKRGLVICMWGNLVCISVSTQDGCMETGMHVVVNLPFRVKTIIIKLKKIRTCIEQRKWVEGAFSIPEVIVSNLI